MTDTSISYVPKRSRRGYGDKAYLLLYRTRRKIGGKLKHHTPRALLRTCGLVIVQSTLIWSVAPLDSFGAVLTITACTLFVAYSLVVVQWHRENTAAMTKLRSNN
jgi:hypothetical protein